MKVVRIEVVDAMRAQGYVLYQWHGRVVVFVQPQVMKRLLTLIVPFAFVFGVKTRRNRLARGVEAGAWDVIQDPLRIRPRKTKELIMVGITCAMLRPRGVRLHSERALNLGASPREVLEAMEVAAIPGGMPGLWMGVETLQDIVKKKGLEFK